MDAAAIKNKLCKVLETIQVTSGLECPPLTGTLRPIEDIKDFDSKIWPVAIGMLSVELDEPIPEDVNIFRMEGSRKARNIDQTVAFVEQLIDEQKRKATAAE